MVNIYLRLKLVYVKKIEIWIITRNQYDIIWIVSQFLVYQTLSYDPEAQSAQALS